MRIGVSGGRVVFVATVLLTATASLMDAQELCDPGLEATPNSTLGYRVRGDRCEGTFVAKRTGAFDVVAFTDATTLDAAAAVVFISWPRATDVMATTQVQLRAFALRPRLHYRMDTVVPLGAGMYRWRLDIVKELGLGLSELALTGRMRMPIRGAVQEVYLPVHLASQDSAPATSTSYRVVIVPNVQLDEVYVSLVSVDSPSVPLPRDHALGFGYYPAGQGVTIPISVRRPGLYQLQIGATSEAGVFTRSIWFVHAGSSRTLPRTERRP